MKNIRSPHNRRYNNLIWIWAMLIKWSNSDKKNKGPHLLS